MKISIWYSRYLFDVRNVTVGDSFVVQEFKSLKYLRTQDSEIVQFEGSTSGHFAVLLQKSVFRIGIRQKVSEDVSVEKLPDDESAVVVELDPVQRINKRMLTD